MREGHLRRGQISIHAPRMGSDAVFAMPQVWWRISIHAPRMGSDLLDDSLMKQLQDFNPRSPDGERPEGKQAPLKTLEISIHAPRMGSDRRVI